MMTMRSKWCAGARAAARSASSRLPSGDFVICGCDCLFAAPVAFCECTPVEPNVKRSERARIPEQIPYRIAETAAETPFTCLFCSTIQGHQSYQLVSGLRQIRVPRLVICHSGCFVQLFFSCSYLAPPLWANKHGQPQREAAKLRPFPCKKKWSWSQEHSCRRRFPRTTAPSI